MWTHYADDYSGIVAQFGKFDVYDSPMLAAKKVVYSDEAPVVGTLELFVKQFSGQVAFDYEKLFGPLEITKKKHWEYEQEWRVISNDKDSSELYSDIEFHPHTLCRIYLGYKADTHDRETILSLCRLALEHVEVYDSTIDQVERRQVFRQIK